jgi:hypothetical protein
MVDHQWRDIEQRHTVRGRGIDLLLMQIQSNAARPAGLQEPDQLCEGPSDSAERPNQHLTDRTAADRLYQRQFAGAAIMTLPHRRRAVCEYVLDSPSTLGCDAFQARKLLF